MLDLENIAIPGYRLEREIGRGGMGIVFQGVQEATDRQVAIKFVKADWIESPIEVARFRIEAEVLGCLDHPQIVRIRDIGVCAGFPWFAMDYVEGIDPRRDLKRYSNESEGLIPLDVLSIVSRVAKAVHHAHARGIIHRDLKPANILLTKDRHPMLTDFGLARLLVDRKELIDECATFHVGFWPHFFTKQPDRPALEGILTATIGTSADLVQRDRLLSVAEQYLAEKTSCALDDTSTDCGLGSLTAEGDILGTPAYLAPEQASKSFGPISVRTDIYALGVILFEVLTGRHPFVASSIQELILKITQGSAPKVSDFCENVSEELELVCARCLVKDQRFRYPSALELAADLDNLSDLSIRRTIPTVDLSQARSDASTLIVPSPLLLHPKNLSSDVRASASTVEDPAGKVKGWIASIADWLPRWIKRLCRPRLAGSARDGDEPKNFARLDALCERQTAAWQCGKCLTVESLIAELAPQATEAEILELVYAEIVLRTDLGRSCSADEYLKRFPQHADSLRRLFAVHDAFQGHRL